MKNCNDLITSICLIYVIVYIVMKVWFNPNPNYETFFQGEKLVSIRDVIGSTGLIEVTFRKPLLDEGDSIIKYLIIVNNLNFPKFHLAQKKEQDFY